MTYLTSRLTAKHRGQLWTGTLRSAIEYGLPLPFLHAVAAEYNAVAVPLQVCTKGFAASS